MPPQHNGTAAARIELALPEQRRDLDVSLRELARLSGVSRSTITRLERGGRIEPRLLMQIAATLTLLELYTPMPPFASADVQDDPVMVLSLRPTLALGDIDRNGDLVGGAA